MKNVPPPLLGHCPKFSRFSILMPPLRLKAWVKEVEGLFYWDFLFEPKKLDQIFSGAKLFWTKNFLTNIFFRINFFSDKKFLFFGPKIIFWPNSFFRTKIFKDLKILWTKNYFGPKIFMDQNFFGPKICFWLNFFGS